MLRNFIVTITLLVSLTSTSFSLQMIEATDWIMYQEKVQKIEYAEKLSEGIYSELFLTTQETFPSETRYLTTKIRDCTISQGDNEEIIEDFKGRAYISLTKPSLLQVNEERYVQKPKNPFSFIKSLFIEENLFDNCDIITTPKVFTMFHINKEKNDILYVFNTINLKESVFSYLRTLNDPPPMMVYAGIFGWSSYITFDLQDRLDKVKTL